MAVNTDAVVVVVQHYCVVLALVSGCAARGAIYAWCIRTGLTIVVQRSLLATMMFIALEAVGSLLYARPHRRCLYLLWQPRCQ